MHYDGEKEPVKIFVWRYITKQGEVIKNLKNLIFLKRIPLGLYSIPHQFIGFLVKGRVKIGLNRRRSMYILIPWRGMQWPKKNERHSF